MSRWIRPEELDEWGALLSSYQRSSFHFEAQQIYSNPIENARLADFIAGRPIEVTYEWRLSRVRERRAAGCTVINVRIVAEPQTDYTRMEVATYPVLVAGGEDVRIIPIAAGTWPDGLPLHDYYLFDDHDVWRMHYDEGYSFAGAELLEGADTLAEHRRWRDVALGLAVPLNEYGRVEPLPT